MFEASLLNPCQQIENFIFQICKSDSVLQFACLKDLNELP